MASLAFSNHPLLSCVCHGDTPCVELTQGRERSFSQDCDGAAWRPQGPDGSCYSSRMRTNATMSRTLRSATTRPAARRGAASCSDESLDELKARGVAVVTKAQVAAAFQVSERTITKMMGRQEIPFFRLGERLVRFRVEEAIKHMEAQAGVVR